jgi:mRNA-degrading endonuclease RelE of RelBE toxin-antitoxin system
VERDLADLNLDSLAETLDKLEAGLLDNPRRYPMIKGPYAGLARMKLGKLRVIFMIAGEDIIVLRIGKRLDLYSTD